MIDQEYTYEVSNIKVESNDGNGLFAFFDVKQMDEEGDLIEEVSTGEWIDLENGFLVDDPDASNLWYNHQNFDRGEIQGIVNDFLHDNPISEDTLEEYRVAKAEREEEINKRFSM